jgi:hypothetical protein
VQRSSCGPAQALAVLPGVRQSSTSSFPQNLSFELREYRQQAGHRATGRRGQVQCLSQWDEPDSEMLQFMGVLPAGLWPTGPSGPAATPSRHRSRRRHPVVFSFRTVRRGSFYVTVDGSPGAKIDALLQELMLSNGLYYYACSVTDRRTVAAKVIAPLFQQLLESRFAVTHHRFLRRHILGTLSEELVPSDVFDPFAHKYAGLFRKWNLRMITDYDFVKDLDDLLTDFMLANLGHTSGQKSPPFDAFVGQCGRANIIFEKETRKSFSRVHELRTRGLHRREKNLNRDEISTLAVEIYLFFQYFDEFIASQQEKMVTLRGKLRFHQRCPHV